jgi:hypothetical protein
LNESLENDKVHLKELLSFKEIQLKTTQKSISAQTKETAKVSSLEATLKQLQHKYDKDIKKLQIELKETLKSQHHSNQDTATTCSSNHNFDKPL